MPRAVPSRTETRHESPLDLDGLNRPVHDPRHSKASASKKTAQLHAAEPDAFAGERSRCTQAFARERSLPTISAPRWIQEGAGSVAFGAPRNRNDDTIDRMAGPSSASALDGSAPRRTYSFSSWRTTQ